MLNSNTKSIPELVVVVCLCLNINSRIAHIDQLRIFIHSLRSNIDVGLLAINETKLDSSITNNEISIPGYDVVRRDRQHHGRNGGRVCLYVKSNLNFKIRDDLANKDLELIFVQIFPTLVQGLVRFWKVLGIDLLALHYTYFLYSRRLLTKLILKILNCIYSEI
jgi:hypothetical protein